MATDEWRMCVQWLVRCKILPDGHQANSPNANAFDIAQALRDGVLICHLLNQLSPGCVDQKDFSPRPQMSQFLCIKNIRTFLQTCKRTFGLKDSELFQPFDLFDVKDFRKVLETLSKLSKTDIATRRTSGFPPEASKDLNEHPYYNDLALLANGFPPENNVHDDEDEDIYGNLPDLADENDVLDDEHMFCTNDDDTDDIYNDIIQLQGNYRRSSTRSLPPPTCKRDHCIKELIDTEKNYVDALEMIVTHFIKKLRPDLQVHDREVIFLHIEKLLDIHKRLYDELFDTVTSESPKIADIFIRVKSELIVYGAYCSNLPIAQERIDKLCEMDVYRSKILECERVANEGKFHLRDLLSVPMQRVLKYHLLLGELIKNTDKNHRERQPLEAALEAMKDLSLYINEVKRDHESLQLIEEIQRSIFDLKMPQNTTLRDYGRFQKDGELRVLSHMDTRVRNRHIFLFDKVMLMCKARMVDKILWNESYSFKDAIVLGEYKIEDKMINNDAAKGGKNWNWPFVMFQKTQGSAFTCYAKTQEARQKWLDAIKMAMDNTQPENGDGYIMWTFEKPRACDVCGKLLRGIFFQGYWCGAKKKAVHKECIGKESSIKPPARPPREAMRAKALKPYKGHPSPNGHKALKFSVNDVIEVLDKTMNPKFWKGRLNGEEGYFPAEFVTITNNVIRKDSYIDVRNTGASNKPFSFNGSLNPPKPLETYPWFVGEMEREVSQANLQMAKDGTFLIRRSRNPARNGLLSLSIKYANVVRHIKVNEKDGRFYLAENKMFESVPMLVEYYSRTTLADSFPDVQIKLEIPFKETIDHDNMKPDENVAGHNVLCYAKVMYDYAATSTTQVSLNEGDRIAVTSKNGNDRGWWKGKNLNTERSGYFPLAYVTEDAEG